ncbi:MAG TPA: metalloregulator ArsR/SmtB family transcription factor [Prolixibacteraceae bacterium]|mgnify:CR=1 FL=1|nr:metalloregulator ArsR/SmtB family transcription factor [Prolixibacteraceae bacterium]
MELLFKKKQITFVRNFTKYEMKIKEIISEDQKQLARYAKALGHPVRVYVIELLSKQSCCYSGDLSEELPIAKSTLSQHLKELKDAGLIQGEIEAPKIKYCINKENWNEAQRLFQEIIHPPTP